MNPNNGVSTPPKGQYSTEVKVLYKIKANQSGEKKNKKINHQHMLLNYSWWESLVFADHHHRLFSHLRLPGFPSFVIYRNINQFQAGLKWVFFCSWVLDN